MTTCASCTTEFIPARSDAKFCSGRCRVAAHRRRHRLQVPTAMARKRCWVTHRSKVPMTPGSIFARSNDPATWRDFSTACRAAAVGNVDGVGFMFDGTGIAGIDLDHCITDGVLEPWAAEIVPACAGTYIEVSPSGTGLHIFGLATVGTGRRRDGVEVYDRGRYFTVTGDRWGDAPLKLADIQAVVDAKR